MEWMSSRKGKLKIRWVFINIIGKVVVVLVIDKI